MELAWEDFSKYEQNWQQQLLFDLSEITPGMNNLPYFPIPKNDNERLFNLQYDYYGGDKEALGKMFVIMEKIAPKLVNIESKSRQLDLPKQKMTEIADEAVMIFIESIMKKDLVIKKSFIAYLRLQVLRALFYFPKSAQFVKWLKEKNISFVGLSDYDKMYYKELFEYELKKQREEREENK